MELTRHVGPDEDELLARAYKAYVRAGNRNNITWQQTGQNLIETLKYVSEGT